MWIYLWLAIIVIALVVEFCTNEMVSVWFAGGGLVAVILAAFEVPWVVCLPVFLVLSFVLLLCFRKVTMKYLNRNTARVNADSAIGKEYELLSAIEFNKAGTIKINDVVHIQLSNEFDLEQMYEIMLKKIEANHEKE